MKSVLIVGGSGGIGQALVRGYLQANYLVTFSGRNEKNLLNFVDELKHEGLSTEKFYALVANVTEEAAVENLFLQHEKKFKTSPQVVINLAAQQAPLGLSWQVDAAEWMNTIGNNLFPVFLITKKAINAALHAQKKCSIIHFSGGGAAYARSYFSAYGCSKTAVLRFVETVACELQEQHIDLIQINALAPGGVKTKMTEEILAAGKSLAGEKALLDAEQIVQGQGASPLSALDLCLYLSDREKNQGISGRLIHVNDPYKKWDEEKIKQSEQGLLRRVQYEK